MARLLAFLGATLGGWLGWALGDPFGTLTAFLLSVVGTGVGIWAGRRVAARWQ